MLLESPPGALMRRGAPAPQRSAPLPSVPIQTLPRESWMIVVTASDDRPSGASTRRNVPLRTESAARRITPPRRNPAQILPEQSSNRTLAELRPGVVGVALDLADRGHQRRDDVAAGGVVVAPDIAQERGAFDHPPRSLVEVVEHLEFQLRQVDAPAIEHELSLAHDRIHGDLSAYNVLYWRGAVTLIDFAQAVDPRHNDELYTLLERDIDALMTRTSMRPLLQGSISATFAALAGFGTRP